MPQQKYVKRLKRTQATNVLVTLKRIGMFLALIIVSTSLLGTGLVGSDLLPYKKVVTINKQVQSYSEDTVTTPTFNFSLPVTPVVSVSSVFEQYYTTHAGPTSLGTPLTTAFPIDQGWLQFFRSGALFLPAKQQAHVQITDSLTELIDSGVKDQTTRVTRLPLLQTLLTVGSQVPIDGSKASLTYVDLRRATNPNFMRGAPSIMPPSTADRNRGVFIKGGTYAGKDVGHFISPSFWDYINRTSISPDGWKADFGIPLTEVLSFTSMKNGSLHHMQVQVFSRDGVLLDQDTLDASGKPVIQRLNTGIDYVRTLGFPNVAITTYENTWIQKDTTIFTTPGAGQQIAHIGQNFPLTLLGDTAWSAGILWYHVKWTTAKHTSTGWVPADAITFTSPGHVPVWSSLDILAPNLVADLAHSGNRVGVVVYDVTQQRYYTYNNNVSFAMASSVKVPIMLTFLDMVEQQNRDPDDQEMQLLTAMIENSDNDAASALYYDSIGGADAITNYMQKIGVPDVNPDPDSWGYTTITPQAMVKLLTLLHEGKILTAPHRALALNLMQNVETDQQVGVGDTAPQGATVSLKDGWVVGPDGLWVMNSSGIVTKGKETYIIAVYTQQQDTLDNGQAIVRQVCSTVASALL